MDRFIRRSPRFLLWQDIQDIIGPANKWPRSIRRNFWNQNLKHFDRILLAAFVFVNALNPVVFLEWGIMNNLFRFKDSRYTHFENLFRYFREGRIYNLYAWHVLMHQYQYLDGRIRRRN